MRRPSALIDLRGGMSLRGAFLGRIGRIELRGGIGGLAARGGELRSEVECREQKMLPFIMVVSCGCGGTDAAAIFWREGGVDEQWMSECSGD